MGKRITYKNIFGMGLAVPAFSLVAIGNAQAQECAALPTCEEFGYLYTAEECAGQKYVKCPFDQTKYFCLGEDTSTNCQVGNILYSDKTCSSKVIAGRIPIGVVFNTEKFLAIALTTEQKALSTTYFNVVGLTNLTDTTKSLADWAGKSNTNIILNYCKANSKSCPAVEYANAYTTAGTSTGDWYLPAMAELNNIYQNKTVLNKTLSLISGAVQLPGNWHWPSTYFDEDGAWAQNFSNGSLPGANDGLKSDRYYVRPVLAYKGNGSSGGSGSSGDSSDSGNTGGNCSNPKVGDILYSDKSCSSSVVSGKTPIAVVFNAEKRLAVGWNSEKQYWSTESFYVGKIYSSADSAKMDWAGKSNTDIVVNYCKSNGKTCPAFEYVNSYTTAGTKAGDWYLPALGELNNIYENITVINNTLSEIIGTQITVDWHVQYWSSSEKSKGNAWFQEFYYGSIDYRGPKDVNDSYVLPVLAF